MVAWIRRFLPVLALGAGLGPALVLAQDLPSPTGEIILTVTGDIARTNDGDAAVFDLQMLRDIGEVTFSTTTPWTDGVQEFTGVPLFALTDALGIVEGTIKASAINDYAVDIPVTDAVEGGPILAYLLNGEPMSVRKNGPLWLVYPYDLNKAYQAEVIYSRSIWQLVHLKVAVD
jgi:hypothetical protein